MSAPTTGPLTLSERFAVYAKGVYAALFFALSVGTGLLKLVGPEGLALPDSYSVGITAVLGVIGTALVVLNGNADRAEIVLRRAQAAIDTNRPPLERLGDAQAAWTGADELAATIRADLARLAEMERNDPGAAAAEARTLPPPATADVTQAPSAWT